MVAHYQPANSLRQWWQAIERRTDTWADAISKQIGKPLRVELTPAIDQALQPHGIIVSPHKGLE